MKYIQIILFASIISLCFKSYSQPILSFLEKDTKIPIGGKVMVIIDKKSDYNLEQIINNNSGEALNNAIPNLGLTNYTFWIRFKIINNSTSNLILKFNQPLLNEVNFYSLKGNEILKETRTGEYCSFQNREYQYPAYSFNLGIQKGDTGTYVLKFKSNEPIMLDISVGTQEIIMKEEINKELLLGIYIGILVVMMFYNLFIYFTVLDTSYLAYVIYIISVGLTQITLQGYGFKYIWPELYEFNDLAIVLFSSVGAIAAIRFLKVFLRTKDHVRILHHTLSVFEFIFVISVLIYFTNNKLLAFSIVQITTLLLSIFILFVSVKVLMKGFRPAIFFLIAWLVLLLAAFIFVSKDLGLLPYNFFTVYSMQIGSSLEVVLLSFALADRINVFKKEKEQSQAEALRASEENRQLIAEQNIVLEEKVHVRTQELEQTNEELTVILENLKDTQAQLVDAEKMASLGQLTAGIAHEINNPINFVSANIKPLKMDIADILQIIEKYETITPNSGIEEKLRDIELFKKRIDLNYVKEEIGVLLSGIEEGARRTAEIVSGLKNFSRLDESELKEANINDGIESTLVLLRSSIPKDVEVITNLGKIPYIECYPGKLNQVFMNILNNAIHAMAQKKSEKHVLAISTWLSEDDICVNFEDTGIGMKSDVKNKVFEPFFTTKDVGEGTGLGMSIVFKIIESHHGKIEIETEYGKGTKVLLTLHKKINLS